MSQHNALSQHIIELGNTCLYFTNLIEKKKDSSIKLIDEGKIPRSLRLNAISQHRPHTRTILTSFYWKKNFKTPSLNLQQQALK
jgi:hypothetical protein